MTFEFKRFALLTVMSVALCVAALDGRHTSANSHPPAYPQAKKLQPATHFTQGTIASISANQMIITKKVRGKAEQANFTLNSQTERSGDLAAGTRVSVQYREENGQKVAASVRELTPKSEAKPGDASKSRSKS